MGHRLFNYINMLNYSQNVLRINFATNLIGYVKQVITDSSCYEEGTAILVDGSTAYDSRLNTSLKIFRLIKNVARPQFTPQQSQETTLYRQNVPRASYVNIT